MRYIKETIEDNEVHLYPIVCMHIGAKQSNTKFIECVIKEIHNDPKGRFIYMGDAGECVTKTSKGNIYEQLLSPGDQLRAAVDLLDPIRDRGLWGIRGNHGNRIDRDSGIGWDEMFCTRLGIPYLGVSALGALILRPPDRRNYNNKHTGGPNGKMVSVYTHHGSSGSITPGGKMQAAHRAEQFILADLMLSAHTHACGRAWPDRIFAYVDTRQGIKYRQSRSYVCGSAYDSRSGYAEEKMYPPIVPEYLCIRVRLKRVRDEKEGHDFLQLQIDDKRIYLNVENDNVVVEEWVQT